MQSFMSEFADKLLDILPEIPALQEYDNRTMLLRYLPSAPVGYIKRSQAMASDLNNIVTSAEAWGQLEDSGEWALAIIARNALRFSQGTPQARELISLLANTEILPADADIQIVKEVVIGRDERLPVSFLEEGLKASRSVARVLVPRIFGGVHNGGFVYGTGWLLTSDLLMTNHHVISARDRGESPAEESDLQSQVARTVVWFDYNERDEPYTEYRFREMISADPMLDYALLRLRSYPISGANAFASSRACLSVHKQTPALRKGDRLNIIQHPQGGPKRLAIRSNFYVDSTSVPGAPYRFRYLTDTEPGSSGSPVFDDGWRVVGLHEAAVQVPETQYRDETIKYNNQGILINAIIDSLPHEISVEIAQTQKWK